MAYDYNRAKELWEGMDQAQKQQYVQNNKNDANFQRFAQEYHNETYGNGSSSSNSSNNQNNTVTTTQGTNTTPSNTNTSNSNNQNGTNGSYDPIYYRNQNNNSDYSTDYSNSGNTGNNNQGGSTLSDGKNGNGNFYGNTSFDKEEQFDKNMIGEDPGKITIQAGTGKTTGRPDYEDSSDARINELTDNLNRYYQTNPEYFADRETFNRQFEYNQRMSDRQRATLDSYWKKAQDIKTASQYTTGDRISAGMDNAEITPDVFNLIKQNNPEAYAQYQKEMQDWINKCMANLSFTGTEPLDVTLERIINKLGIGVGDPHDIKKVYYDSLDKLNVWKDSEQLHVLGNNISSMMSTMNSNAQSLSSQLEGRYSAGYIEARINKANSNIQRQLNTALNSYQMLLQGRQQNIALATQNAQIEQAQAQEEQRIFDDKLKALGFAMDYNSYRTPEQKAALELQKEQISNNMDVLKQSQMNDLALYNKYANAKLDNQLNYEMQDLTVTDPKQLRANLSNVLDQWYSQYGDIIERPKSQVIEDVLAYAKDNGVSVGEALRQEFVKKLMGKDEYVNSIASKYTAPEDKYKPKYEITWDKDGNPTTKLTGYGDLPEKFANITNRSGVQGAISSLADAAGDPKNFIAYLQEMYPEGTYGGECGAFVNDVLKYGLGDDTHLGSDFWTEKYNVANKKASEKPRVGDVYLMSSKKNSNGHTGMIVGVSQNGDVTIMDSNGILDENGKGTHTVRYKTYTAGEWEQLCNQGVGGYKVEGYYESPTVQYSNPMSAAFRNGTENVSSKTADERTNFANAQRIYDSFYNMKENGMMEKVIMGSFGQDLFSNLITQTFSTEKDGGASFGAALIDTLEKNYERGLIDGETKAAITEFARAIEIKLRKESGAAISASEWKSDFMTYMPGQGKGLEADIKAMEAWDGLLKSWTEPYMTKGYKYKNMFDRNYFWNITNGYQGISNLDVDENNIPAGAKKKNTTTWYGDAAVNVVKNLYSPTYGFAYNLYNYFNK